MISFIIKKDDGQDQTAPAGGVSKRISNLQRRVFETLFDGLECDHEAHRDFENVIVASMSEKPPFRIEKICCEDFRRKIKEAVM